MINDFSVDMDEYLPLRDVVFNTLRKARAETGRKTDGDCSCGTSGSQPDTGS